MGFFKVNENYVCWCPKPNKDDYDRMEKSIRKNGIKNELHVLSDGTILCGHTRYEIAQKLGIKDEDIPYKIVDIPEEYDRIYYIIDDNISRRQLNLAQKIQLGSQLEEVEQAKAKERMINAHAAPEKLPEQLGDSRDKIGEHLGISGKSYEIGKKVMEERPEDFQKALEGEKSLYKSYIEIQKDKKEQKIREYNNFLERVGEAQNIDIQKELNELNYDYLNTSIEFIEDLIISLSNCEYITKETYEGKYETNLTRITRISGYDIEKEKLIKLIEDVIYKMKKNIVSYEKILEYYKIPK